MKGGASMANSLGVITIMYTCAGIGLTWLRGTDDSFNTVAAAATSAAVFRSPGMKTETCTYYNYFETMNCNGIKF